MEVQGKAESHSASVWPLIVVLAACDTARPRFSVVSVVHW